MFDRNVPMPSLKKKYYFDKMEIGESIYLPIKERNRISSTLYYAHKKYGFLYTTRKENDGIRVWRVK